MSLFGFQICLTGKEIVYTGVENFMSPNATWMMAKVRLAEGSTKEEWKIQSKGTFVGPIVISKCGKYVLAAGKTSIFWS